MSLNSGIDGEMPSVGSDCTSYGAVYRIGNWIKSFTLNR